MEAQIAVRRSFRAPRGWLLGGLILALGLVLVGCHRSTPARPARPALTLTLSTQPAVPAAGQDTTFTLLVRDARGRPVTGASARLTLRMTTMDMGTTVVPLSDAGAGRYVGRGGFSMGGDWDCQAEVQQGDLRAERLFHYKVG